jgi:hypothetical protein
MPGPARGDPAGEAAVMVLGLPGARRRFTGSFETASFRPEAMPSTSWLLDAVPSVDPDRWRLTIKDGQGPRELTLAQLTAYDTQVRNKTCSRRRSAANSRRHPLDSMCSVSRWLCSRTALMLIDPLSVVLVSVRMLVRGRCSRRT